MLNYHQRGLVGNFSGCAYDIYAWYEFENYQYKITAASPRDPRVNTVTTNYIGRRRKLSRVNAIDVTQQGTFAKADMFQIEKIEFK